MKPDFRKYIFHAGLICLLLSCRWFEYTSISAAMEPLHTILWRIAFGLFCIRIMLSLTENRKYAIVSICALALSLAHFLISGNKDLLTLSSGLCACVGIEKKDILRIYQVMLCIVIIAAASLCLTGAAQDVTKHYHGFTGHSFGLMNPNSMGVIIMMLAMSVIISSGIRKDRQLFMICIPAAILSWCLTLCKTSTLALLLLPFCYIITDNWKTQIRPAVYALLPVAALAVSLILMLCFGDTDHNLTFGSRFSMPYVLFKNSSLSLSGLKGYIPIDNLFIYILTAYGLIFGAIVLVSYCIYHYKAALKEGPVIISMMVCILLCGFMETIPLSLYYNFLLPYTVCSFCEERRPSPRVQV